MSNQGDLRMPPVARHEPDRAALELFARWIDQMPRDWNSDAPAPEPPPLQWRLHRRAYAVTVALATILLAAGTLQARRTRHSVSRRRKGDIEGDARHKFPGRYVALEDQREGR
jgi:hypothetical protein